MEKATKEVEIPAELRPVVASAAKNLLHHLYGPDGPPWGTSFADLEDLLVKLSRSLGTEMLQQALQRQADRPVPAELQHCPDCSGPLQLLDPEPRSVHTRTGTADWQEPARHCPRCRRDFFPSKQEPGHRPD